MTCDDHNENHGRLLHFKDELGKIHEIPVAMEWFAGDGLELRQFLMNRGLFVHPERNYRTKIATYIQLTKPPLRARSISRIGWHGST